MSGTISTRWFWSDWMSDTGLRASSYAARGLWKDLLCIAGLQKGRDYGFVLLNGKKPEIADIAQMTNGVAAEVEALLLELKNKGVCSTDRRGVIYCRRMVRAEKSRGNGRLGGNPNLMKNKENTNQVQPRPKALIPEPEPEPIVEAQTAQQRGGELDLSDWPADYREQFWTLYPRRLEKKAALSKLEAIKRGGRVTWQIFKAGLERYAAYSRGVEARFIKHPTTWLNRGCWDDEQDRPNSGGTPPGGGNPWAAMLVDEYEGVQR